MVHSKSTENNSDLSEFPIGCQCGQQLCNARKRTSRILEDKTNVHGQAESQAKKIKQCVHPEENDNVPVKIPGVVTSVCTQIQSGVQTKVTNASVVQRDISVDFDEATQKCEQVTQLEHRSLNVIFPCDFAMSTRDGHLFPQEYILPIMRSLGTGERIFAELFPCPNYFDNQKDIRPRMRTILFAWMTEVHMKFKLKEVVLWASFQICDRFLSKVNINRKKLQLVGCTSLWIASKYHEIFPPLAADLVHVSDNAFSKDEIIAMERRICDVLSYQFSIPNVFNFLDRYTNIAVESIEEPRLKNRVKWLARYGLERFHLNVMALRYCPSLLAAGALFTALRLTSNGWSRSCEKCSDFSQEALLSNLHDGESSIFELFKRAIMNFESKSHQAIIYKYKKQERGCVSTLRRKEKCLPGSRRS